MKSIPASLITLKNQIYTESPWVWLYTLSFEDYFFRLCESTADVTFDGNVYEAFPIAFDEVEQTVEGDLVSTALAVADPTGTVQGIVDSYRGMIGGKLSLALGNLSDPSSQFTIATFEIAEMDVSATGVRATLAPLRVFRESFPKRGYYRTCQFVYRDSETCKFPTASAFIGLLGSDPHPTCDHTLGGPNGCRSHGADPIGVVLGSDHPRRFGGFPTIPRRRGA